MTATPSGPSGSDPIVFHVLPVGGGIVVLSALPGAGGDLVGDIDHLVSWTPAMVLSVVEEAELAAVGAQSLGAKIQDKGARWVHMPVAFGGIPTIDMEMEWPEISVRARKALLGGGRVVVQSPGGAGRAGMIVLRLMIEAGEAPDEALERLSAVHLPAIGTQTQTDWAMKAQREAARFVRHK
jgi:protein-tyrosine phosphatase